MTYTTEKLYPIPFKYLPDDFDIKSVEAVNSFFDAMLQKTIHSPEDIKNLLLEYSDIQKAMSDELSWRYVYMTVNADDASLEEAYNTYYANVFAPTEEKSFQIKQKLIQSPFLNELDRTEFDHLIRILKNETELFREENIPLNIQESELANKYGGTVSKMSVLFEGSERTPSQLSVFLKNPDRDLREAAWRAKYELYKAKNEELDRLFDSMKEIRVQIAKNVGFDNYRDYKHQELGRFSYTPEELYAFHAGVEKVVMPFVRGMDVKRKEALALEVLKPWDTSVDLDGRQLKPFETTKEFIEKGIEVLHKVHPEYAKQLAMMNNSGLLDLENRKGKAPGGYNTGINNLGSSFIFMNHVQLHRDVVTLLHEAGHAMHSAATKDIPYSQYLETPSEVAELASMSMELFTMDYWDIYYPNKEDFKKAKREQLEGTLSFLPWCMTVDAFQHWVYLNPEHTPMQRDAAYLEISSRYSSLVDWTGLEMYRPLGWKMQLHIFEVPFYYIEYGMAQLGALSLYKNYREDKTKALAQYQSFLNLGYSTSVKELYNAAGIEFDFSEQRLAELVDFVRMELKAIDEA